MIHLRTIHYKLYINSNKKGKKMKIANIRLTNMWVVFQFVTYSLIVSTRKVKFWKRIVLHKVHTVAQPVILVPERLKQKKEHKFKANWKNFKAEELQNYAAKIWFILISGP